MAASAKPHSVVAVGLGNSGSQFVPLLGSIPEITSVGLIDFDRYESANLGFQRIAPSDVGRFKADVQAGVLRRMRPDLTVVAHPRRFEEIPLGILRDSIIVACLDSRAARQALNCAAFAIGVPWIDAALGREGSVRARAYLPGKSSCLECGWGPRDYELLEQRVPCAAGGATPSATAAAPELGAIAAGLAASLCRRLVTDGSAADALVDRQWFYDVPSGRGWSATYAPNPDCRLDHARWDIVALGSGSVEMALRDALALGGAQSDDSALSVLGQVFVHRTRCPKCGTVRRVRCRLSGRLAQRLCGACGAPVLVAAIDSEPCLSRYSATDAVLGQPLARRGFVAGDVVSVGAPGAERHYQLA